MILLMLFWLCIFKEAQPDFPPPPGTIKISKNLFVDKRAVTYLDYNELIHFAKVNNPELLNELIPGDTTITYKNEVLWNNPKFHDFPIVGLNKQQIFIYCVWRSEMVNKLIENPELRCSDFKYWKLFDELDPDTKYKVNYTLPSKAKNQDYCRHLRRQEINEILIDGICSFKKRGKHNSYNEANLTAFRCIAEYDLRNH